MTETLLVKRVDVERLHGAGRRFVILARRPDDALAHVVLYTFNMWRAARCQAAEQNGELLRLGYRDTKWGEELITVEDAS